MNFNLFSTSHNQRVLPNTFQITEEYYYEANISHIHDLHLSATHPIPSGKIEIIVPYDELRTFNPQSTVTEDIILISKYEHTDLDARLLPWGIKNCQFPLQKILQHSLRIYSQRNQQHNSCLVTVRYEPQRLLNEPLSINIKVYDQLEVADTEAVIRERKKYSERNTNDKDYNLASEIAKQIIGLMGFDNSLIFEFHIKLSLPGTGNLSEGRCPRIRRFALKWPVTTSQRQVQLLCDNEPKTVTYNPKDNSLIFGDINISPNDQVDKQIWNYCSPLLRFEINEPAELYNNFDSTQVIDGRLTIEVPALLSGMTFTKIQKPDVSLDAFKIRMRSLINVDFSLFALQLFQHRYFSPYQHLQFPNVELNEMRLADIVLLLQDLHFRTTTELLEQDEVWSDRNQENNRRQWLIVGERSEGARVLKLWIVTEGISSGTKREKEIPGKEKYTTTFATGSMRLYIRGQIEEDMDRSIQAISQIHEKLKERFQHVTVME